MAIPQSIDAFRNIKMASMADILARHVESRRFFSMIGEKLPCAVHYDAGGTHYVRPDQFRWTGKPPRPSDSVWIVPGTFGELR